MNCFYFGMRPTSQHLVVLNRKVENAATGQEFQGSAVHAKFFPIPAEDREKQPH